MKWPIHNQRTTSCSTRPKTLSRMDDEWRSTLDDRIAIQVCLYGWLLAECLED